MFNTRETAVDVTVDFFDLHVAYDVRCSVANLWAGRRIGNFTGSFVAKAVRRHDTHVVRSSL